MYTRKNTFESKNKKIKHTVFFNLNINKTSKVWRQRCIHKTIVLINSRFSVLQMYC